MAPLITQLDRKGLIARAEAGRAQPLSVTAEGEALAAKVRAASDAQERKLAAALGGAGAARMTEGLRRLRGAG
ncbi:MAG: hypothetical protein WDN24_16065 [Sphingomonas sp.]